MKMIMVTEKEMAELLSNLELIKLRLCDHLSQHDPQKALTDKMFRSFYFMVANWISEVSK